MSHIQPSLDFGSEKELNTPRWQMLRRLWERMAFVINGNLTFGDGTHVDNIRGYCFNGDTPNAPDTDFVITHSLGTVPAGFIVLGKNATCDIYNSPTPNADPKNTIILRATTSATVRLFIC